MINQVTNNYYLYDPTLNSQNSNTVDKLPLNAQIQPNVSVQGISESQKKQQIGPKECKTCHNRKYKDQSSDSSVSFQTPTSVAPELAASAVAAHENQHVIHNAEKAEREGMRAVSTVQLHVAACPECGRIYVSGGTTTATFVQKQEQPSSDSQKGQNVNTWA